MASINLTGLAANDPVPGFYQEILFGVGPVGGFSGSYSILLIGNRTSAGTATLDTVVSQFDSTSAVRGGRYHVVWRWL